MHDKIKTSIKIAMVLLVVCTSVAQADPRWVVGTYRNLAEGYSIKIPRGLRGRAGEAAGPERGPGISLPSGGTIVVFGEPNSLEYKNPAEGVRAVLAYQECASGRQEVSQARVGRLIGAKGSLVCGDQVVKLILAFRTGGGPIYWLQLDTTRAHESEDDAILEKVAASFKLIRWE
jgi:hypothetical protein